MCSTEKEFSVQQFWSNMNVLEPFLKKFGPIKTSYVQFEQVWLRDVISKTGKITA